MQTFKIKLRVVPTPHCIPLQKIPLAKEKLSTNESNLCNTVSHWWDRASDSPRYFKVLTIALVISFALTLSDFKSATNFSCMSQLSST